MSCARTLCIIIQTVEDEDEDVYEVDVEEFEVMGINYKILWRIHSSLPNSNSTRRLRKALLQARLNYLK